MCPGLFERPHKREGQGSGKSVEDEGLMGKDGFEVVRFTAEAILAVRDAIGERRENAVSDAIL
ncbi:hypothetical protein D3C80_498710 [compost metagenome]